VIETAHALEQILAPSMRKPNPDSRRHRRVPVAIRVFSRERSPVADDTHDVSIGGFSVATDDPLPAGTVSLFSLAVPHHEVPLQLRGVVVWSVAGAMGVRLTEGDGRYESYVDRLIKDADRI
jgi:hypothetical protein